MTIPTIGELKGNTILELFNNGYSAVKKDVDGKQDKLVAGSNIVINGNTISAIEGGTAVLDDYYTKEEVDAIVDDIDDDIQDVANELPDMTQYYTKLETDSVVSDAVSVKADASTVYTKSETNTLIANDVVCFDAQISNGTGTNTGKIVINEVLKNGDVLACKIGLGSSSIYNFVATYNTDTTENRISTSICGVSGGSSGTTYYFSNMIFRIYSSNGNVVIDCVTNRIDINSGTATETNTTNSCNVAYSSIKIYRKREVE